MRRYGPPGLSSAERADRWCRWKAGYHVREIARTFGRDHGSIRGLLARRGGIAPRVRIRGSLALPLIEREDISRGIASGESGRSIADRLGRAASTVSHEILRHGGRSVYRAKAANEDAWELALRPKPCLLAINCIVRNLVASKLVLDWSPEQISGWLKNEFPDDESMRVSHETIYRSLFIQARGVLKKRADRSSADQTQHASSAPDCYASREARAYPRCSVDPRATCGGRGPSRAGSLGRRLDQRLEEQPYRDSRGAPLALHRAHQSVG